MKFILLMGILLLMFAVTLPFRLQLKVEDHDCPQDVKAVKTNKIMLGIFGGLGLAATIASLCFLL